MGPRDDETESREEEEIKEQECEKKREAAQIQ